MLIVIQLPGVPRNRLNRRRGWWADWREGKRRRASACMIVSAAFVESRFWFERHIWPVTVLLRRIGPRMLDDDNLVASLKSDRDGIADALGMKDNDKRLVWKYAQASTGKKDGGFVLVEITTGHTKGAA